MAKVYLVKDNTQTTKIYNLMQNIKKNPYSLTHNKNDKGDVVLP